jgi:hypothetical protein
MMDLDDVLPHVGEFGRYQKLVLWFILLPGTFPCGFHAYNQLFMAATPEHWCKVDGLDQHDLKLVRNIRYSQNVLFNNELGRLSSEKFRQHARECGNVLESCGLQNILEFGIFILRELPSFS